MMNFIDLVVQSFNLNVVFSSMQSFLSSGYIFAIIAAILIFGAIKKLVKLVIVGAIIGMLWFIYSSGLFTGVLLL